MCLIHNSKLVLYASLLLLIVTGCSDGGNSSSSNLVVPQPGTLNISITDAPVDTVIEVWIEFDAATIKPQSGDALTFEFDPPLQINLLALTGENTAPLLNNQSVPAGEYNWVRLDVNADNDGIFDSFVMTETGEMIELEVTSQQGLRLVSGFTITESQTTRFVIDFDLRKSLTLPKGQNKTAWRLRPALRITDLTDSGSISGTVAEGLLTAEACTNNLAEDTGNSVYIFSNKDVVPEDIHTEETDPLTTASVTQDANGFYTYSASFLPAGDYSVAFTCQALDDDPEADDDLVFSAPLNVVVTNNADTTVDFVDNG